MDVWTFCSKHLEKGKLVTLLIVVENRGSSPGKPGFKMAVSETGEFAGTIGGGNAEYEAVEIAKQILDQKSDVPILKKQVHRDKAEHDKSGMICSGEQDLVIVPLNSNNFPVIHNIAQKRAARKRDFIRITPEGINFLSENTCTKSISWKIHHDLDWEYIEDIGLTHVIQIFGGGHVSLKLCEIMNMLDFHVKLFDNRPGLSSMQENQYAHQKVVINYNSAGKYVAEGDHSYVVIMTAEHLHDFEVLQQMVGKNLKYLGMMGSRSKVGTIHKMLRDEGFRDQEISKVFMPVGEPISSHTPAEIAVSISAQIIRIKNRSK